MSSIDKGLIIYRGARLKSGNRSKTLKYGLHLRSIEYAYYSSAQRKRNMKIIQSQGRKRATAYDDFNYRFKSNQDHLVQDIGKISGVRRFELDFYISFDFDFYKSESSLDSQFTVDSDGEYDSENELDREIRTNSKIIQKNKRTLKKIFKQVKRVTHFTLAFEKMDLNHNRAFHYLPMLNLLEDCHIKIKIRDPTDILAIRDLLNEAKQRNYWPNMKSMVIKLRHSYNKEHCTPKFIRFCKILQEISEIAQCLPWFKIQLKVKYMWRLDKSAILALRETLEKAQNQLIKLSFITDRPRKLEPLFKPIEEMKNLQRFSIRFDGSSGQSLLDALNRVPSLRRLKVQGKTILKDGAERFLESLGDFNQITSFSFQEKNQFIDKTLWNCFSNSISKLPQLQVLILRTEAPKAKEMSPDLDGFLDFFEGLKNFQNLKIFTFEMCYSSSASKYDGSQIFKVACEALQNQKELRKLNFHYPWICNMNSDLQNLTKVLPHLQKLERFYFHFAVLKFIEPVQNDVFLKFCKAICYLNIIESFQMNFEMEEIDDLTYEAVLLPLKHLKNKDFWRLTLGSMRVDEEIKKKINELSREIDIWKKE